MGQGPLTAILCFSDAVARGVIRAIQDGGLRVPDDVSVVGFDDNPIGRRTRPALTKVRQDVDAKGRAAAAALTIAIDRVNTRPASRGRHLVLPTELVVRDSTTQVVPDSSVAPHAAQAAGNASRPASARTDSAVTVTYSVDGERHQTTGVGYHDRNWGNVRDQ